VKGEEVKRKKRRRMVVESIDVGFEAGKGRARSFFFSFNTHGLPSAPLDSSIYDDLLLLLL